MKRSKYNSFSELPLMLTVQDVADVLGIGLAHALEVAHRKDFPTITLGSRIIVPRDKLMAWIDEQAAKKSEIL
ncbi:helix-turn-helix domain-containing protein [Anaerotruncus colihominis]|uniref:helix-turn-helix domain-containing protein n=1 Tax=Anaerotruncus colihominis TaxID=169435 RepID=UPI0018995967|nr:helix-turn-helix domain-containing protein [Anaerotruncus colihominis]